MSASNMPQMRVRKFVVLCFLLNLMWSTYHENSRYWKVSRTYHALVLGKKLFFLINCIYTGKTTSYIAGLRSNSSLE